MKKNLIIILFIIAAIATWYLGTNKPDTPKIIENSSVVGNGRYVPYSKDTFTGARTMKRVLYFHADWCPTCRPLDREFTTRMDSIPQDVVIFKTNYDTEIELKKTYAITYQHTFVQVDDQDTEISKWNGGNFDDVISHIQ